MGRQYRNARLTDEAAEAFDRLCTERGVSYTALIQALGELSKTDTDWVPESVVKRARQLDRQRHSRRR